MSDVTTNSRSPVLSSLTHNDAANPIKKKVMNPKIHHCPYSNCNKSFHCKSRLSDHLNAHSGNRPYVCDIADCLRTFTSSASLYQHHRLKHMTWPKTQSSSSSSSSSPPSSSNSSSSSLSPSPMSKKRKNNSPNVCEMCKRPYDLPENVMYAYPLVPVNHSNLIRIDPQPTIITQAQFGTLEYQSGGLNSINYSYPSEAILAPVAENFNQQGGSLYQAYSSQMGLLTSLKYYVCPYDRCIKKFSLRANLENHLRVHMNEQASRSEVFNYLAIPVPVSDKADDQKEFTCSTPLEKQAHKNESEHVNEEERESRLVVKCRQTHDEKSSGKKDPKGPNPVQIKP